MSQQPYSFEQARSAAVMASNGQKFAETELKKAAKTYAQTEEAYRVALAQEIVRKHDAGVAWSVAPDLARGEKVVAALRVKRDVAEGVREAMQHMAWRKAADRRDTQRFIEWSMRRELAEGYGVAPEPEFSEPIGGGRR